MTLTRLTNERWGFSSNCYVCEPSNQQGLRLEFFHDTDRDVVSCTFELSDSFSGAPTYVHGGVTQAVLDEVQAWAAIAVGGKFAVTTTTTVEFRKPVRVGRTYTAEAEVVEMGKETMQIVGRILDHRNEVRTEARSTFYVMSPAVAADAIGEITGDDAGFLRDDS